MIDFDAEPPPARRSVFGNINPDDHRKLEEMYAGLRRQFLIGRDAYDELVARAAAEHAELQRANDHVKQLEAAERAGRRQIARLQTKLSAAERSAKALEAKLAHADQTMRAELAGIQKAVTVAQERIETLRLVEEARQRRLSDALADAASVVEGLPFAITELAALVEPGSPEPDDRHVEIVVRRLFPRLVERVSVTAADRAPTKFVKALTDAPHGRRTWKANTVGEGGERPLDVSGALAIDVVVLARYRADVYADGDVPSLVERICHALAASLATRRRARLRASDRGRVTMLADESALDRLRALHRAQGLQPTHVSLQLGAQLDDEQVGLFGAAAWNAHIFDCAGQLDRLAREHGGEAFELDGAICCLVPRRHADAVRTGAVEIAAALDLEAEVIVS